MNPRERVLAAIRHEPVDRFPTDIWATPEVWDRLEAYFHTHDRLEIFDRLGIDGLAGISVFIEKASQATHARSGLSGRGAANVYKRIVGDNLVTVVGEVPPRTVIQVGDSVRYAGQ